MENLDSKKLFDIFDKHPLDGGEDEINSYKTSFHFKINMFIKVVLYGEAWKNEVVSIFTKSNVDMDVEDIDNAGNFMLYTRAWYWISQFDFEDKECVESLTSLDDSSLLVSLLRTIKYFEGIEEFERCHFLVNIKNLLK